MVVILTAAMVLIPAAAVWCEARPLNVSLSLGDWLAKRGARAGVPHETCPVPAKDHGFDVNWGGFATQIARAKMRDFLARYDPR